ncbi:MAG: choice-of-anchor W domain-containing protein [Pseudomonadota bacterium]
MRIVVCTVLAVLLVPSAANALTVTGFQGDTVFNDLCNQGTSNQDCEFAVGEIRGGGPSWEYGIQNPPGTPVSVQQFTWASGDAEAFTLSYVSTTQLLSLVVGSSVASETTLPGSGLDDAKSLFIRARSQDASRRIEISNMTLGGEALPNLSFLGGGSAGAAYLQISGFDLSNDWILSGEVTLTWPSNENVPSNSQLDVNFKITDVAVPLPAPIWMMLSALGLCLFISRRRGQA